MKKKIILILLTIALIIAAFSALAVVASAETTTPEMSIAYCNISFRNNVCIKYAVNSNVSNIKILIWTSPEAEYIVGTHDGEITDYYTEDINGISHMIFDYTALTAKQMSDVIYARAYAKVDGVDYYSGVNNYSILQYAYNKLGKTATESTDTELKEMLTNMLLYGATAQKYFDYKEDRIATAEWYQVKLTAGVLDDGCKHGLYLPGDKVTMTAPETGINGDIFSHWADSNGNEVATTTTYELTVGTKNEVYTSVYVHPAQSLAFNLSNDGTYYIVTGIGTWTDSSLVIPDTYKGLPVTSIDNSAFDGCTSLTSVTIPDSITSIGSQAFWGCSSLTSVTIGKGVTSIGSDAFFSRDNNLEVYISDIGAWLNISCGNAASRPNYYGRLHILDENKIEITELIIPDIVTYIDRYAFYNCTSLTSITIPSSVTSIRDSAFWGCTSLTSVTTGENVTNIGNYAFYNCSWLNNIELSDKVKSINQYAFWNCASLTSIKIPESVTSIGYSAFEECSSLTSITIPNSVTSIRDNAFRGCASLTSVTIGKGVTSISSNTFSRCNKLKSITFEDTSTWYLTTSYSDWNSMTGGTIISVIDTSTNATYFTSTYARYYWYKI